ncbi:OmpP1/FadL family transporter [Amaricoccus macauensis]|uniref:OmpP1/FadL family transporter n=1 Tax=Amaricoccus macauensis TaxID=57001 RepID=UPI003C7A12E3
MSTRTRHPIIFRVGAACLIALGPGAASAAGFQLRELSAEGLGNAFAGNTAKATDLSTVYLNPAGMAHVEGSQVQGDLSAVVPTINFSGSATSPFGTPYTGGDGGDAGQDVVVPSFYGVWEINPTVKAGLSVNVPFGLSTKYDDDWVGRYFAIESEIQNMVITPSISWQATEQLSLGAGIQIGHADATLSNAVNLVGLGFPAGTPDGYSKVSGSDYGYGYTLGMLYEFSPTSRIGLSYRSRIEYTLDGELSLDGIPGAQDVDAEADLTTPDVLSLGAYHELNPKWAVMGEVSWTNWSLFEEMRIEFDDGRADQVTVEDWDDSLFFALGADYKHAEDHTFHFGIAYDQSPVPDEHRTARIPDSDRYWVSLGYSYDFSEKGTLNLGYTHLFFDGSDIDETMDVGNLSGDYSGGADIFAASVRYRF